MEKRGVVIPLALAVVSAGSYMAVLTNRERELSRSYENATIMVARVDLPERTVMKADLLHTRAIPRKFAAPDAFEVRTPSDLKLVANLVTRVRIPKGGQIAQSALTSLSPTAGLSLKVPPGYRGAVVPVEPDLLKLVKPGDRVDVLLTFDALMSDNRKEKVTATLLQNVLVLGVGGNLGQGAGAGENGEKDRRENAFSERGMMSVALNPNEVQYLALALRQGEIMVSLRNPGDVDMHPMPMASLRKLFSS